jgi:hypothetical protein
MNSHHESSEKSNHFEKCRYLRIFPISNSKMLELIKNMDSGCLKHETNKLIEEIFEGLPTSAKTNLEFKLCFVQKTTFILMARYALSFLSPQIQYCKQPTATTIPTS